MDKLKYVIKSRLFWFSVLILVNSIATILATRGYTLGLSESYITIAMLVNSVFATLIALLKVQDNVEASKLYQKLEEVQYNVK